MPATKTPPMIAPGVLCPRCKGPMLDERQDKRSDKSPDYTCANMLCVETKNGKTYRTAIWADKGNGATSGTTASTDQTPSSVGRPVEAAPSEKPKLAGIYLEATRFVLDQIVPLYVKAEIGVSDTAVAAMTATLFIAKSKELQ